MRKKISQFTAANTSEHESKTNAKEDASGGVFVFDYTSWQVLVELWEKIK